MSWSLSFCVDDMAQPKQAKDDPAREGPPTNTNTGTVYACRKNFKVSLIAM